jgi:hypothetical protein
MKKVRKALLFLKKKQQKNSGPAGCGNGGEPSPTSKSFLLLFFKKEALFS